MPKQRVIESLYAGEVGFVCGNVKKLSDCQVGDTITTSEKGCKVALAGFQQSKPVVFCGMYPADANYYGDMHDSMAKLQLNDSSFTYDTETSKALGFGFRCGFLGMLHLEIVQERLEREFNIDLVTTAPSVIYKINLRDNKSIHLHNPVDMPDPSLIEYIEEPWVLATIMLPDKYLGAVLALCINKRGIQERLTYVGSQVMLVFRLPLNEIVFDFYERLKSCSKGYASCDWEIANYEKADLVRLSILINAVAVDALCLLMHRSQAEKRGREICCHLKELIPRHLFAVPIQAAIGGKIIARETISALRKDVTAKCYGGDVSRKRKLLEKQKKGKKRLRLVGNVDVPQSAFISVLKVGK